MSARTRKVESQLKEITGEEVAALSDPRIQGAVGAQTRLKRTPRLRFEPDPVVEQATRIEAALREVRTDDDANDE